MNEHSLLANAILVAFTRLKQAEDSFELFKDLVNLANTSTNLKRIINDDLLVNISYRYIRARSQFILNKLKYFIRYSNSNGFNRFADLVYRHYSKLEASRVLCRLLIYVIRYSEKGFIESYLDFISLRLHPTSLTAYLENEQFQNRSYMGFHPKTITKSIKLAQENKWIDKTMLLFDILLKLVEADQIRSIQHYIAELKELIVKSIRVDLSAIGSLLMALYHPSRTESINFGSTFEITLERTNEKLLRSSDPSSFVEARISWFDCPVEQRPWFFGNVSDKYITERLKAARSCFIEAFRGSKVYIYTYSRNKIVRRELSLVDPHRLPTYALSNGNEIKDWPRYQFYRSIVENDLERAKTILKHAGINWEGNLEDQPHPLMEYLNRVDDIEDDIVQFLYDSIPRPKKLAWERANIPDQFMPIIIRLLEGGTEINSKFLLILMRKEMPVKMSRMTLLSKAWTDTFRNEKVFEFIFNDYRRHCQENHVISETKMLLLSAWKFDQSSLFNCLPLEIMHVIVQYVNEDPLAYQLAYLMADTGTMIHFKLTTESFERCPWVLKFFADHSSHFTANALAHATASFRSLKFKVYKQDHQSVRKIIDTLTISLAYSKLDDPKFFEKHLSTLTIGHEGVIAGLQTKNRVALKFILRKLTNYTITEEYFYAKIKDKHSLTFEEAMDLLTEIKNEIKKETV